MQLLSALSSTTSPLAMQAMPLVATPTGDFAALIAGMAPAGDMVAMAVPVERQAVAPTGNPLPVPLAAPVAPDMLAPAETVAPVTPPLPVSATQAVLMLPQEAAAPVTVPIQQVAPVLVAAAAIDGLADVLPDEEMAESPPRAEEIAARAQPLPVPVPTRFAVTPPRAKRAEDATPDTTRPAHEEDGTDFEQQTADAAVPVVAAPLVVPQPADAIVIPATVQPGDPAVAPGDGATPAATLVIEGGEVVAAEPMSAKASPMRMAKRADAPLPPAAARRSAAADPASDADKVATVAEPAIGIVTPLATDQVVPVHVVVPSVAEGASVVPPPVDAPVRDAASTVLRPATVAASAAIPFPAPATPVPGNAPLAAVAPRGLAGAMIDLLPVSEAPLAAAAPATPAMPGVAPTVPADAAAAPATIDAGQSASTPAADAVVRPMALASSAPAPDTAMVSPAILPRPTIRAGFAPAAPASHATAPTADAAVARGRVTAVAEPVAPVPIVDRPPTVGGTIAPVARSTAQPTILAPPVTRIAGVAVSDTAPAPDATTVDGTSVPATVRHAVNAPAGAPAAMPPVTRIAAVPLADVAPVMVDAVLRDSDVPSPRVRQGEDPSIPTTGTITAPDAAVLRPVAPTAQAAPPTLDTRQPQWMEGIIDRITTLREASGTNNGETRIRLSPDALGDVEVAIRTGDDGRLHVHFNSENADAGRLLAEAQPRLLQMAEARGLKLGGMQVDVGSQQSGQSQRQAQDQGNPAPRAPRNATRAHTQTTRSDDRIA